MPEIKDFIGECDFFLKYLKIKIEEASRHYARVSMPFHPYHRNGWGAVHGGVICALADAAFGAAANYDAEYAVVTLSTNISFIMPGFYGPISAESNAIHLGHKILNYEVCIYDGHKELLAKGMVTGFISNKLLKDCIITEP